MRLRAFNKSSPSASSRSAYDGDGALSARPGGGARDDDLMRVQFRVFIAEVLQRSDATLDPRDADPVQAARALNHHLSRLIALQTAQLERDISRFEHDNAADARYLKVALADELLLALPWAGRTQWTAFLLESSLYGTNIAGDQVFHRIDALLAERAPARRPMARLYLLAIAMGFAGRYRQAPLEDPPRGVAGTGSDRDARARLDAYRHDLFQCIFERDADLDGIERVVDPAAYAHTLSHIAPHRLPALSRWALGILVSIAALLAFSEIVWLATTWPVRDTLRGHFTQGVSPDGNGLPLSNAPLPSSRGSSHVG